MLLAGVEFPEACKHFPIVFAKVAGTLVLPMALLGFRDQENLFVDGSGEMERRSTCRAYIRRYPFVLAKGGDGPEMTVCIDESYPGFGADEGQPLFDAKGEATDYLKEVLKFLQDYQAQIERTDVFLQMLREFDLLTDAAANVNLAGGERYSMKDLMVVDERKLQALPEEKLMRLFRSGGLAWVYSHLISLGNFEPLGRQGRLQPPLPRATAASAAAAAAASRKNGGRGKTRAQEVAG